MNTELLREQVIGAYLSSKAMNAKYSKRAHARRLGISHGALIEIMNGKRQVSESMARRLCDRLLLNPKQQNQIFDHRRSRQPDPHFELREDQFELISDWCHFGILNLLGVEKKNHSADYLAKRLGLSEKHVAGALGRLLRLGLMRRGRSGLFERTNQAIKSTDDVRSVSIRLFHRLMLELSATRLDDTPIERRDFASITIPVNSRKLPAAKELIRNFLDELDSLLRDDRADEVYSFNTQLIPLTTSDNIGKQK